MSAAGCMLMFQVKKCHICGKRASISLTQIVNGQVSELALCEECARKNGLFDPGSLSFSEKFFPEEFKARMDKIVRELTERNSESAAEVENDVLMRCPTCGFELPTFRKTGRLGCPDCYTVFAREISLESTADESTGEKAEINEKDQLEQALREAVEREDYETAARLRDQIRNLYPGDAS